MRSQFLLRRARYLAKAPAFAPRALLSSTHVPRYPRKEPATRSSGPRVSKRSSSSAPLATSDPQPDAPDGNPEGAPAAGEEPEPPNAESSEAAAEEGEKPKRRARTSSAKDGSDSTPTLPSGLNILWQPDSHPHPDPSPSSSSAPSLPPNSALPPPEIFHEVLTNLLITLHPQTQHRATYASSGTPLVEPTLALYCPIEGGDYIIDETVRELGRKAGAEVVVLDAVQLAAGECGHFGKAASALQLPHNPLHFASQAPPFRSSAQPIAAFEDDDEFDGIPRFMPSSPSQLTLHVLAPAFTRSGRVVAARGRSVNPSTAKLKAFFEELINVSAPVAENSEPPPRLPRIIYIRDFPTLAASSATWYPALLSAVRARRQGPLARSTSPVFNPTTIVFGMTPSIVSPVSESPSFSFSGGLPPQGLMNTMLNRTNMGQGVTAGRPGRPDYSEDEAADKARERRLRDRLRRWERGDHTLQDELPKLWTAREDQETGGEGEPNVVIFGGAPPMFPSLSPFMSQAALGGRPGSPGGRDAADDARAAQFFRTSVIVPSARAVLLEKACRMERRREINELTMRMGVAAVGGTLGRMSPTPDGPGEEVETDAAGRRMWEDWGRSVEVWANVRKIADRAVGKVIARSLGAGAGAAGPAAKSAKASLSPTPVEWDAVFEAWTVHKAARDMRKAWIQQSSGKATPEPDEEEDAEEEEDEHDEVIEKVRRDPELDQHEQRLLGCIVDTASITTTFNHVHLPARTIDSVRTIVSLPLLHPSAFQHGILKEHAMTGCLLFGPPGTGKTLVVRALAKEAGCRMLAVSPSDVMDMYVGEGEKLVRSVFSLARRLSPCVVFIDEIDALFGARMGARESGGAIAHRGVITEFMQEMDGLKSSKDDNIIVIGATNRPFDLDDAVLRRLPRRLLVDLPGEKEREEILKILLRDEPMAEDVDLKVLAHKTESFSGSDLKHLCVSAALDAVKERVDVPWKTSAQPSPPPAEPSPSSEIAPEATAAVAPTNDSTEAAPPPPPQPTQADTSSETTPIAASPDAAVPPPTADSPPSDTPPSTLETPSGPEVIEDAQPRVLFWRNFAKALKEITPSASEALGSLADLRKWNEEFGEGRAERKRQVWGKGRFGFTVQALEGDEGKVQPSTSTSSGSSAGAGT